jgi:hypothetical protein
LVAVVNFMRLSFMKAAHVVVSNAAKQEIRVRSGRDDNSFAERKLFPKKKRRLPNELSSRPERSVVEGPAVLFDCATRTERDTDGLY